VRCERSLEGMTVKSIRLKINEGRGQIHAHGLGAVRSAKQKGCGRWKVEVLVVPRHTAVKRSERDYCRGSSANTNRRLQRSTPRHKTFSTGVSYRARTSRPGPDLCTSEFSICPFNSHYERLKRRFYLSQSVLSISCVFGLRWRPATMPLHRAAEQG